MGRALLLALEAEAKGWGLGEIQLESTLGARTFYQRFGFEPAGEPWPGFGITVCHPYRKLLSTH